MSKDMNQEVDNKDTTLESQALDNVGLNVSGHILIKDKDTGEVLVDKRNAIHYGNMAYIVAQALNGFNTENAFIDRIAFGNGATSVDTAGKILYKTPKVNEAYENSAGLYSRTFEKRLNPSTTDTSISTVVGSSHTDIKVTCTLGYNEPSDADLFDTATNNEGNYVFDELGLFTYPTDGSDIDTSTMLTHVIFHPVQKSQNRKIEIVYTVRVQLS
tara:strand:+ start:11842 stop:12486 length:645 start_codon:yes stop_codon:yes gene_type:complete